MAHGVHLRGDVSQDADLGGDAEFLLDLLKTNQNLFDALHGVIDGIEADYGIADAVGQPLEKGGRDALDVVGRMVGL